MTTFDDEIRMQPFMDRFYVGRLGMERIDRAVSCKGYDLSAKYNGAVYHLEEKFLFTEPYDNTLIEIVQAVERGDMGWFHHTKCDRLIWVYCGRDNGRGGVATAPPVCVYISRWPQLREYTLNMMKKSKWTKVNICTTGYGVTINYSIPWEPLILKGITKRYNWSETT